MFKRIFKKKNLKRKLQDFFKERKIPFSWRRIWLILIIVLVVLGGFFIGLVAYARSYEQRVLPGVYIGEQYIGGMEKDQIYILLQTKNDDLVSHGLNFQFITPEGRENDFILSPIIVAEDGSIELLYIDAEEESERLINYGKNGDFFEKIYKVLESRISKTHLEVENIIIDRDKINLEIKDRLDQYEEPARNADVNIKTIIPLDYTITTSSPGVTYEYSDAVDQIVSAWSKLKITDVIIKQNKEKAEILETDVKEIEDRIPEVFTHGGLQITYTDPHLKREYNWWIKLEDMKNWLSVQKTGEGDLGFGLVKEKVMEFFSDNIEPIVNIEAENARFEMNENGKVVEFKGSRPGIGLDKEKTYELINDAILQRSWHDEGITNEVQVMVEQVEPEIKTGEVNDLGVAEVLGVGISDFSGSPRNRIRNIANAIAKLNGVLIKPGEEFSTIAYTRPFTYEGGYYPELVIKGDEIKPEIGGGLCQIGTTLFRMAMNAGMDITQRRNHSLVVHYYNDPVNGLPGTDATIYDPAPDFRFLNDTDNYVLIQAQADYNRMELIFTLWGTDDGRTAYFTHPTVTRWIPYGETREVETTKIAPGERECQHAYTGADAFFTYFRQLPDEEEEKRVFTSHYRPLPQICLVGVEDDKTEQGNGEDEKITEE
ncbi:MAG: hypothetical protein GF349_04190 [Candidatus Magasanikbacteria bacterium]|nr:hypothetical protein [Candidatus Magasanikbacteria bacterium]